MNKLPKVDFYGAYISIPIHLFLVGWLIILAKGKKNLKATFFFLKSYILWSFYISMMEVLISMVIYLYKVYIP